MKDAQTHVNSAQQLTRRYLEALSGALGVDELTSKLNASALLAEAHNLARIEYKTHQKHGLDPKDAAKIEAIGQWFLSGSHQQHELKFPVGATVLALLKEDTHSRYYRELKKWVTIWTDGAGGKKFEVLLLRA